MTEHARDDGFTLVELLLATVISLIITGVLVTSIIVGLKNADAAGQRLTNSHDAQQGQSYFTSDVLSADLVDVTASDTTCAGSVGDTLLVRFRWAQRPADPSNAITYQVAVYRTRISGSETQLVRQFCSGTSFAAAPLVSTVVLAHSLNSASLPTVTCTNSNSPTFSSANCTNVSSSIPFVAVRLSGQSIQTGTESSDALSYTLTAARRSTQ